MNLDKEFEFIMSVKDFIKKSKKSLNKNEYVKLEYFLNEPIKKDIMEDDLDDSPSVALEFNPNYDNSQFFGQLNDANLLNIPVKKETVVNNEMANHYKNLLNYRNLLQLLFELKLLDK